MTILGMEHYGFIVCEPCKAASWYEKYLGFEILRAEEGVVAFVRCISNNLIIELIAESDENGINKVLTDPLQAHMAIKTDDYETDLKMLLDAGAQFIKDCVVAPPGKVCLIKDPYNALVIQLAQRESDFYRKR